MMPLIAYMHAWAQWANVGNMSHTLAGLFAAWHRKFMKGDSEPADNVHFVQDHNAWFHKNAIKNAQDKMSPARCQEGLAHNDIVLQGLLSICVKAAVPTGAFKYQIVSTGGLRKVWRPDSIIGDLRLNRAASWWEAVTGC